MKARLAAALVLLSGCRCGAPPPPLPSSGRDGGSAAVHAPGDSAEPPVPALRGATSLSRTEGDERLRILGEAAKGLRVQLFLDVRCQGAPLATGTAEALASPGLEVSLPRSGEVQLRATALDATGRTSACSEPLRMKLDPPVPDSPDSWKQAGFASLAAAQEEWHRVATAQRALQLAAPPPLQEALAREGVTPVALLSRLPRSRQPLPSGDFNCDGARDFALVGLPLSSRLGAALAEAHDPPDARLGPLLAELRRISLDGGSEVMVALSDGPGFTLFRRPGNGLASVSRPASTQEPELCDAAANARYRTLRARKACDPVEYLVGENAGSGVLLWDAAEGKLADLPDRCQ